MLNKTWSIFLIVLLITVFAIYSCIEIPGFVCENTVEKEIISPNRKFKAVIYDRGCGTATDFMTGISIVPVNYKLGNDNEDYVLFAEEVYRNRSYINEQIQYGSFNFDVKWINDEELLVFYTEAKNLSKKESYNNIKINYELISK
jgi:hypothetical protein